MSEMNRRDFGRTGLTVLAGLAAAGRASAQAADSRAYRYVHLDVFTDRRMQGNQLLVFVQPAGLDADAMQALTRESNYSECTFVFPPEQAGTDHRVRIFTRTAETPFAGHPTLGTAFALAHTGVLKPSMARTNFGLGVGPTNIDLEWKEGRLAFAWMTQLKPAFGKSIADAAGLASAIGLDANAMGSASGSAAANGSVRLQPDQIPIAQEVNCGSNFMIVPLATRKAVDAAVLDREKVDAVFAAAGIQRRGLYVFSTERGEPGVTAYSRLLGTGGIEDPATGSAAGPAGCFAAKYGFVPPDKAGAIVFLQGVKVGRPSRLHVNVTLAAGEVTSVKVGGAAAIVGEGTMSL